MKITAFCLGFLVILPYQMYGHVPEFKSIQSNNLRKRPIHTKHIKQPETLPIRVLLNELDSIAKSHHTMSSDKGFMVKLSEKAEKLFLSKQDKLNFLVHNNALFLRHKNLTYRKVQHNTLSIIPLEGHLTIDNNSYSGELTIQIDQEQNKVLVINKLSLDDYIYSVLRYESLSHWPLEVQKVQAIASRTYAVYQMIQQRKKKNAKNLYDIKNSNFHQVYNGNHSCTHLWQAVHETHNLVLTHEGRVCLTMFDICCGGVIPHFMKTSDITKPYLYRDYACKHCKKNKLYRWKETISTKDFLKQLKKHPLLKVTLKEISDISSIKILEKDAAGIVYKISLHHRKNSITVTTKDLKSSLDANLKSLAMTIKKEKNSIVFSGFGYGHNIGLCQLGARTLVDKGWNYQKILNFYYPQTSLNTIKKIRL